MNYKKKCKNFGYWDFLKFKGDLAVFASCRYCGYTYPCSKNLRNEDGSFSFKTVPDIPHRFCPNCGLKMKCGSDAVEYVDKYYWEE